MKISDWQFISKNISLTVVHFSLVTGLVANGFARSQPSTQPVAQAVPFQQITAQPAPVQPMSAEFPGTVGRGVSRAECFPVERLSTEKRREAEELLLRVCDSEALYTLVGGVKPMSSDWLSASFNPEKPDVVRLNELRETIAQLRCGDEITAHLVHSPRSTDGKVSLEGALFSRLALGRELNRHAPFWQQWALTERAEPLEVLLAIKYAPSTSRFRGYGYLYGYPDHAVDFFVEEARLQQENPTHKPAEREPVHIPTFSRQTHRFVYAVPKGHALNESDRELRAKCVLILAEYKKRRQRFIGEGKPGIVALLRDWFHDGQGNYSPRYARF